MEDVTAFVVAVTALVVAVGGFIKIWYDVRQVHQILNSRLDELLRVSKAISRAEGRAEGVAEGGVRRREGDE